MNRSNSYRAQAARWLYLNLPSRWITKDEGDNYLGWLLCKWGYQ